MNICSRLAASLVFVAALGAGAVAAPLPAISNAPPNVRVVLQKLADGKSLSTADQKILEDWGRSRTAAAARQMSGGGNGGAGNGSGTPAAGSIVIGMGEAKSPCSKPTHAALFGGAPSRASYLAITLDVLRTYAGKLSPDTRNKLNAALDSAQQPAAGSDIAPVLMMLGETDAAVFAAAYSAQKLPDDPLAASNLGAMLRGAKDYARAATALLYARSLAPKHPLIATNLGWLAMSTGDVQSAGSFFRTAVSLQPKMADALSGQGLVQMCGGHPAAALPFFRASEAVEDSMLAEAGIDQAVNDVTTAKSAAQPSMGSASTYGQKANLVAPTWPEPPVAPDAKTMAGYAASPPGSTSALSNYTTLIAGMAIPAAAAVRAAAQVDIDGHTSFDGHAIVMTRGYRKETFVLSDLRTILNAELIKPINDMNDHVEDFRKKDGCISCGTLGATEGPQPSCSYQSRVISTYPPASGLFRQDWNDLVKAEGDLYAFSAPWLQRIQNPTVERAQKALVDQYALSFIEAYAGALAVAGGEVNVAWTYHLETQSCGNQAPGRPKQQPIKPYPIDATKCRTPPSSMPFPFVSMDANCDRIKISVSIGVLAASGQYRFAPDYTFQNGTYNFTGGNDGQWTLAIGGKASSSSSLPVGVSASVGEFITVQGGQVTDFGPQVSVGAGPNVDGLQIKGSETVQIGATSGPDFPAPSLSSNSSWSQL